MEPTSSSIGNQYQESWINLTPHYNVTVPCVEERVTGNGKYKVDPQCANNNDHIRTKFQLLVIESDYQGFI